jgi:hypothetical protein
MPAAQSTQKSRSLKLGNDKYAYAGIRVTPAIKHHPTTLDDYAFSLRFGVRK